MKPSEPHDAERQRRFPWRYLIPVPVLLIGEGGLALYLPRYELDALREQLEAELTAASVRADVIAIAGTTTNSLRVEEDAGTVERESISYGLRRNWLSKLNAWALRTFRGKQSMRMVLPEYEVRWYAGRCLGVHDTGAYWPDDQPGLQWPAFGD